MAIPQLNFRSQVQQRTLPRPPRRESSTGPLSGIMEQMLMAQSLAGRRDQPDDEPDPEEPDQGLPFNEQVQGPQGNVILDALRSVNFQ